MKLEPFILNTVLFRSIVSWNHCQFSDCLMLTFVSKCQISIFRLKVRRSNKSFGHWISNWVIFMMIPIRPHFVLDKMENSSSSSLHLKSNVSSINFLDHICRNIFDSWCYCDDSCVSSTKILLMALIFHVFVLEIFTCCKMSFITTCILILLKIDQVFVFMWI